MASHKSLDRASQTQTRDARSPRPIAGTHASSEHKSVGTAPHKKIALMTNETVGWPRLPSFGGAGKPRRSSDVNRVTTWNAFRQSRTAGMSSGMMCDSVIREPVFVDFYFSILDTSHSDQYEPATVDSGFYPWPLFLFAKIVLAIFHPPRAAPREEAETNIHLSVSCGNIRAVPICKSASKC